MPVLKRVWRHLNARGYHFVEGQEVGQGGRVATLQVDYFCVSQGPACVQKKVHGQRPPRSVGCFPH